MTRWTRTYRFIDHSDAEAYRAAGWTVVPLDGYHAVWSLLAWRYA